MSHFAQHEHHEFLAAADEAMRNAPLQLALSRLADTLGKRNREAYAQLEGSAGLREQARAIKDATLAELDKHLTTLTDSVQRLGGHVHLAGDGAEACRIIGEIIREEGARRSSSRSR